MPKGERVADTLDMSFGSEGLSPLQDFEKFEAKLYDTDGGGHCTVGWGHLVHKGTCDGRENEQTFSKGVTKDGANDLLKQDTGVAERAVNQKVAARGATLTQSQFDALVSFTYNVGTGNLEKVLTGSVGKDGKLDLDAIPVRMRLYEKSSGESFRG